MKYAMLIYNNEQDWNTMSEDQKGQVMNGYDTFTKQVMENGLMKGGEALQPIAQATTVRVRDGQTLHTDGPFAETKEQLGGFYLLDCKDLDEAIEYAAKIPGAANGSIEIRPIVIWE
jgi:hypothetical protein